MSPATTTQYPELAGYGLAGHTESPRDVVAEARLAEEIGLGSLFLSERFNVKDAGVMAGAVAGVTDRLGIATAATNHVTRHPLVTATMATTAHRMSEGRYALGLGRGFDVLFDLMGLPRITGAQMEDAIGIYRRLWRGESVVGHEGPAGSYPYLNQDSSFDEQIPVLMMAIGDRSLELAGRVADGVGLHTFLTDEALARMTADVDGSVLEKLQHHEGVMPDAARMAEQDGVEWGSCVVDPNGLQDTEFIPALLGKLLEGVAERHVRPLRIKCRWC